MDSQPRQADIEHQQATLHGAEFDDGLIVVLWRFAATYLTLRAHAKHIGLILILNSNRQPRSRIFSQIRSDTEKDGKPKYSAFIRDWSISKRRSLKKASDA